MEYSEYVPGVCNIGPAEIALRRRTGWIGFVLTVFFWVVLTLLRAAPFWYSLLFIPSAISGAGFIQAATHFCAGFGMKGLFNLGPRAGMTDTALQAEFRAQDRRKAMRIFGYSILVGIVVAFAAGFLRQISL